MTDQRVLPPPRPDESVSARWTSSAIAYLQQEARCPRCISGLIVDSICQTCFADLRGKPGERMRHASAAAVIALGERQQVIAALPEWHPAPSAHLGPQTSEHLSSSPAELDRIPGPSPEAHRDAPYDSQVSVQSVLAVTGAGLLAVAAIVFTFLNPDFTDVGARTAIVAGVAALFLAGGWLLAGRSLRFSAETIGALGVLFVGLDGWAIASTMPDSAPSRLIGALVTLILSSAAVVAATRVRMRTWLWCGLVGIGITPAIAAGAWPSPWTVVIGALACSFVSLAVLRLIRGLEKRFVSPLLADRTTATVLQITGLVVASIQLPAASGADAQVFFAPVLVLAAMAALAALTTREFVPGFWSVAAGAGAVAAAAAVPVQFDLGPQQIYWLVALCPLAATAALIGLALLPLAGAVQVGSAQVGSVQRSWMLAGARAVALLTAVPALVMLLVEVLTSFEPVAGLRTDPWFGVSAIGGLTFAAAGSLALVRIRHPLAAGGESVIGATLSVAALFAVAACNAVPAPLRSAVALVLAACLAVALTRSGRLRDLSGRIRLPLVVGSHALLIYAAALAWSAPWSQVVVGAGVVSAVALVAGTVPRTFRPVYVSAGFLYTLVVLGAALTLMRLDPTANLCITTSVGVLAAIAATMAKRMSFDTWVAVLASAALPFLVTIAMVLVARSAWTALPTAFTFVLALTIVLDRRENLHRLLRGVAAATLIPALSVVVITLGAQVLSGSAAPVTLPIIAAIVAVAVPSTRRIAALLSERGLRADQVAAVRLWIEISGLVTGAIAILLAVVRVAAGAQTAFLVFLILGFGAAATSMFARRAYGWWAAGACWTGALWSVWVLMGVTSLELFMVPPAMVAAVIGAVSVVRRQRGLPLYSYGLAFAVAPSLSLVVAAAAANAFPLRALLLLAAAVALLVLGMVVRRHPAGKSLELPALIVSVVTATAGTIQAARYGWELDAIPALAPAAVMVPVLAFSLASATIGTIAGWRLSGRTRSRFVFAPALVLLLAGPWTANRANAFPIATLWVLTALLLAGMLATTVLARRRPVFLPPVWLWFGLAWITAVAGWSARELRVEAFSLPLGIALLACGMLGLTSKGPKPPATATSWPLGFPGSWPTLAPGLVVLVLPSVLATATDPLTWRAILVIAVALTAILVGSTRRLAAPFILGLVVLPIENAIVFLVQIGHAIGALPWWITLATAGAVLLMLAVTSERKTSGVRSAAALLRDLR
jgi:hypothetical protein